MKQWFFVGCFLCGSVWAWGSEAYRPPVQEFVFAPALSVGEYEQHGATMFQELQGLVSDALMSQRGRGWGADAVGREPELTGLVLRWASLMDPVLLRYHDDWPRVVNTDMPLLMSVSQVEPERCLYAIASCLHLISELMAYHRHYQNGSLASVEMITMLSSFREQLGALLMQQCQKNSRDEGLQQRFRLMSARDICMSWRAIQGSGLDKQLQPFPDAVYRVVAEETERVCGETLRQYATVKLVPGDLCELDVILWNGQQMPWLPQSAYGVPIELCMARWHEAGPGFAMDGFADPRIGLAAVQMVATIKNSPDWRKLSPLAPLRRSLLLRYRDGSAVSLANNRLRMGCHGDVMNGICDFNPLLTKQTWPVMMAGVVNK